MAVVAAASRLRKSLRRVRYWRVDSDRRSMNTTKSIDYRGFTIYGKSRL
jgi:hypothetical protein